MSDPGNESTPSEVAIRRAPRLGVFLVVGGMLGLLATLVLTSLFPVDPAVGFAATVGYFALFGIPGGVLLGAAVGILFDALSLRRIRSVQVEREVVSETDPTDS